MSEEMKALDERDPLTLAWGDFAKTEMYARATKQASVMVIRLVPRKAPEIQHPHLEGALWVCFWAGWQAKIKHDKAAVKANG
jgi:hypothetical protein